MKVRNTCDTTQDSGYLWGRGRSYDKNETQRTSGVKTMCDFMTLRSDDSSIHLVAV